MFHGATHNRPTETSRQKKTYIDIWTTIEKAEEGQKKEVAGKRDL